MVIPEGWKKYKISECAKIATGSKNTEDKCDDGRYPFFVRSQNIEHINTYNYDCEAVLTAGDGVGTGKVFHYINNHKFAVHQRVYVMSDFHNILGRYFYYYFSKNFYAEVVKYTAKSSVDSVRRKMIADMALIIPESEFEQTAIATALSDMDDLIASLEKLLAKKQGIKQGAMQDLLTGRKRLQGFSGEWREEVLDNLCIIITDGSHISPNECDEGYYMPSVKDMRYDGFDFSQCKRISAHDYTALVKNNCQPQKNDVLIAKDGSMLKFVFSIKEKRPLVILSSIAILRPNQKIMHSEYVAYYFRQPEFRERVIIGSKTGTGVPRIILDNMKKIEIRFPDIAEQRAIATLLSDMDDEITALQQKLAKYQQIKQGMMAELLTGRIRLKEA